MQQAGQPSTSRQAANWQRSTIAAAHLVAVGVARRQVLDGPRRGLPRAVAAAAQQVSQARHHALQEPRVFAASRTREGTREGTGDGSRAGQVEAGRAGGGMAGGRVYSEGCEGGRKAGAAGEGAVPPGQAGKETGRHAAQGMEAGRQAGWPPHPSWVRTSAQQARLLSVQAAASRQGAPQPQAGSSRSDSTTSAPSCTICFCVCSQLHAMLLQQGREEERGQDKNR